MGSQTLVVKTVLSDTDARLDKRTPLHSIELPLPASLLIASRICVSPCFAARFHALSSLLLLRSLMLSVSCRCAASDTNVLGSSFKIMPLKVDQGCVCYPVRGFSVLWSRHQSVLVCSATSAAWVASRRPTAICSSSQLCLRTVLTLLPCVCVLCTLSCAAPCSTPCLTRWAATRASASSQRHARSGVAVSCAACRGFLRPLFTFAVPLLCSALAVLLSHELCAVLLCRAARTTAPTCFRSRLVSRLSCLAAPLASLLASPNFSACLPLCEAAVLIE